VGTYREPAATPASGKLLAIDIYRDCIYEHAANFSLHFCFGTGCYRQKMLKRAYLLHQFSAEKTDK